MKFFSEQPTKSQIIDILSDLKHRVFPRPFERLGLTKLRGGVGAEIGIYQGFHALSLLENTEVEKLYLIDPYLMYSDYVEGNKHYGFDQAPLTEAEKTARKLLEPHKDRCVWLKKMSADAAGDISEKLDFVYIDGNHQEEYVWNDIVNFMPKMKQGGVIGGHDYYNGFQRDHDGVVTAVSRFVTENSLLLQVELPDWWIQL